MSIVKDLKLSDVYGNTIIPYIGKTVDATDSNCIDAFMTAVTAKAAQLNMINSSFGSPSGLTNVLSTAKDLFKLGVAACSYPDLLRIWGCNAHTITTFGGKSISLASSVQSHDLEDYYTLLGGKTGASGSGNALLVLGVVRDEVVCGAIIGATSSSTRFSAMKELFDIASVALNGGDVSGQSVADATGAVIGLVPHIPATWNDVTIPTLFEQNATTALAPASVTKVITTLTMLDYVRDIRSDTIEFSESDLISGSGAVFAEGDVITYEDAIYAMMLPSSNQAAQCVARNVGNRLIATKTLS